MSYSNSPQRPKLKWRSPHASYVSSGIHGNKFHRTFGTELILSNDSSSYGSITDRFLPSPESKSDTKLYNHHHNIKPVTSSESSLNNNNNDLHFRPGVFNSGILFGQIDTDGEMSPTISGILNPSSPLNLPAIPPELNSNTGNSLNEGSILTSSTSGKAGDHQTRVANALGIDSGRIFTFKPLKSPRKVKQITSETDNLHAVIPFSKKVENGDDDDNLTEQDNNNFPPDANTSSFIPEIPFKVLDAPGLRNDFYSNLVCWANKSETIAAGLGSVVYCWNEKTGTIPLESSSEDVVSALSYSSSDFLAVGTKESKVMVYKPGYTNIIASYNIKGNSSICSLKWIPSKNYFFVGNDIGEVTLLKLVLKEVSKPTTKSTDVEKPGSIFKYSLKIKSSFKCDQQQICGLDINLQGKQLAIGANNNCGSIWDISDLSKPKKQFHLKHDAAVKAVAFCPWVPNLLATGGGSRDKHIRFWHSKSGTLISKFKTKGQITAVVWSRSKREILVTFGFGDPNEKNDILAVYTYPSMKLKVKVNAPADMRILTADISNDFHSICTSISDQSVRIYSVWDSKYDLNSSGCDVGVGVFGSEIIDNAEGVDKALDIIR